MDAEGGEDEAESSGAAEKLPEDNSMLTFSKHGKSVFCCDLVEKNGKILAASGGEDDQAYLWDTSSGQVILESGTQFKDSVVHVQFSNDGMYLAAADLSGVIKVWKLNGDITLNREIVWEFETSDISCMFWHHGANVLFAGTVESELWMWKIPTGDSKIFTAHGEKVECAKILPDGKRATVCYGDGTMRLFDLKTGEVLHNFTGNSAHEGAITSVSVRHDSVVLATGGVDGVAKISSTAGKSLSTFVCATGPSPAAASSSSEKPSTEDENDEVESSTKTAVEAILFSPADGNQLITGTLEGVVTIWDVSTRVSRHTERVGSGVVKMACRKGSQSEILVATLDGLVRLFDVKLGKVVADCSGHTASILDFAQTSDGNVVITASDDGDCKLFDLRRITSTS